MKGQHSYTSTIRWTGNKGQGTMDYRAYDRNFTLLHPGKADILGSSDPAFRGDKTRHNPEDLLVDSLASCHMLWYLHLCAEAGIVVVAYEGEATGIMEETADGGGRFTEVTLRPIVTITDPQLIDQANALHHRANQLCFIANSVNFPVLHQPICRVSEERAH
ncbi:OsmC family protein [Tellurirhabdus bombi]|uniref:OsmC family protein n=1 Tax=Tellurirhabdus bombi TaxID=2907205 RepID=UPI001F469EEF|nr:OsmC family protein [Tellurirhabdus bombi]